MIFQDQPVLWFRVLLRICGLRTITRNSRLQTLKQYIATISLYNLFPEQKDATDLCSFGHPTLPGRLVNQCQSCFLPTQKSTLIDRIWDFIQLPFHKFIVVSVSHMLKLEHCFTTVLAEETSFLGGPTYLSLRFRTSDGSPLYIGILLSSPQLLSLEKKNKRR